MASNEMMWIVTLGEPPPDLMEMLRVIVEQGVMEWVLVPVPERPDLTSLRDVPPPNVIIDEPRTSLS